jgi:DNA-binding response OmpR family regulator
MSVKRRKIIYVDDVNYGLMTVKNKLKDYTVYPALTAEKLFETLEYVEPDLILLDINMPGTDGYQIITKLKESERFSSIPVVFLSSQSDKKSVLKGIKLGADGHVGKPFSTDVLIETIESVCDPEKRKQLHNDYADDDGKLSILAVDDVTSMLNAIRFALRDKYKVYMLSKPEDVKDFLRKKTPDLFLLDYNMPVINGFELIPIIRSFPEHQKTPIIFLTNEGTIDHFTAAIHLGACDFVVKPFDPKMLHEKIAKHIKPNDMKNMDDVFADLDRILNRD